MPIEPVPNWTVIAIRSFKWLLFLVSIGSAGYLLWGQYRWWGIALIAFIAAQWALELFRANQTEDYIFENYEDPRR